MIKVITYGTYDLLHVGHIKLLERAKKLGDYLIVGVTAEDFDKTRGKINVQQSLMERVEAVRATGLADEIVIEEYEGQKIDDIKKYNVDIFTVGSDWKGKFDYLKQYCEVVYLDRTEGISSTELRTKKRSLNLGLVGESDIIKKYINECEFVNGINVKAICTKNVNDFSAYKDVEITQDYGKFLEKIDAVYIASLPNHHFSLIEDAIIKGKHVLCESPIDLYEENCKQLFDFAKEKKVILMDAIKTAYSTAYNRLILLAKSGKIGDIISIDSTCTSLKDLKRNNMIVDNKQNSICAWAPTALLPVFQLLGTDFINYNMNTLLYKENFDLFTKIDFKYSNAVASVKVGKGVKSEGELIISGTEGYIYVPAPWWKTDYFEIRFENQEDNKRYFYQLDGEGIRYELIAFLKSIESYRLYTNIDENISKAISKIVENFMNKKYDLINR